MPPSQHPPLLSHLHRALVGSCNAPFSSTRAMEVFEGRGLIYIHEAITSAGAVLADSIERFNHSLYKWVVLRALIWLDCTA